MKVQLQEDFALPVPLKGRPSDFQRGELDRQLEKTLSGLPKCNISITTRIVRDSIGIHDPASAARYVKRVKPRVAGLTIQDVAGMKLLHRDPPNDELDENCLRDCAEPFVSIATNSQRTISEQDEHALEKQINAECACRCQQAHSKDWSLVPILGLVVGITLAISPIAILALNNLKG